VNTAQWIGWSLLAICLLVSAFVVRAGWVAQTPGKHSDDHDPDMAALRAEYAKPLRERRLKPVIEKDMQSIINARLAGGR